MGVASTDLSEGSPHPGCSKQGNWTEAPGRVKVTPACNGPNLGVAQVALFVSREMTHYLEWYSLMGQGGSICLGALLSQGLGLGLGLTCYMLSPSPTDFPSLLKGQGHYRVLLACWPGRPWFPELTQLGNCQEQTFCCRWSGRFGTQNQLLLVGLVSVEMRQSTRH